MRYLEAKRLREQLKNKMVTPTEDKMDHGPSLAEMKAPEVDATDAARRLAEAHGIALSTVSGTGAGGRITVDDVKAIIEAAQPEESEAE